MMPIESDYLWMAKALQLAEQGRYTAHPNPCVGCVIVKEGELLGQGWHYRAGEPHAEVNAIRSASKYIRGACAYLLELCNHQVELALYSTVNQRSQSCCLWHAGP